jgi:hypothetical protein
MDFKGSDNSHDFQEENFSDIDKEWEELNNEMARESENAIESIRARAEYDRVSLYVMEQLRQSELPGRLIDGDAETEEDLLRQFALNYVQSRGRELLDNDNDAVHNEALIAVNCIMEYYKERELQALIVNEIALCKFILENSRGNMAMENLVVHEKKRLQAELLVHHGMKQDNPWYVFLSHEIDTDCLDFLLEEDAVYLDLAKESLERFNNYYIQRSNFIKAAKEVMGINDEDIDVSTTIQLTGDLIELHLIGSEPVLNSRELINRNEQLWEYGRTNGFDNKELARIIALLENEG